MPEFVIKHNGKKHDISKFLRYHPGGTNTLETFKDCDITEQLEAVKHSPSAFDLLKDYKIKSSADATTEKDEQEYDMESLVNWEKSMFWQVGSLGKSYHEWVVTPVDRKLRLFQSDIMEYLTFTPWYLVPSIWIPVSLLLIYSGYQHFLMYSFFFNASLFIKVVIIFCTIVMGYFIWPIIEYSIHRWLFHMDPPADSPLLITLHFTIHGLHHKVPFDSDRLLFPPTASALAITVIYGLLRILTPISVARLLLAGGILGYVTYDLIHFYLHYGSPNEGSYLFHMKRYHNQHHFTDHSNGFGISTDLWDRFFKTTLILKKLKYRLRWY